MGKEPRQRNIPVTRREREVLEKRKSHYEQFIGRKVSWAEFLGAVIPLGVNYLLTEEVRTWQRS